MKRFTQLFAGVLLVLMARAGLHVPAQEGSSLPLIRRVFTDVGRPHRPHSAG